MSSWRRRIMALAGGVVLVVGTEAEAAAGTRVYMMRGLLDVSTGLDDLAAKMKRRGVSAVVASYTSVAELSETAIRGYRSGSGCPVVIVGHSLGADAAVTMAETLRQASVPVALIVAFSPATSRSVPGNVARVVNFYQSNSYWNNVYTSGRGFTGSLRNVDLASDNAIDHFNIEKVQRLHERTIRLVTGLSGGCRAAGAKGSPGKAAASSPAN